MTRASDRTERSATPFIDVVVADKSPLVLRALARLFEDDERFNLLATASVRDGRGRAHGFPFVDAGALGRDPMDGLTARERGLLEALSSGRTNAQLAREPCISVHTVKFHLKNLYDKLGVGNRAQAVGLALIPAALDGFH